MIRPEKIHAASLTAIADKIIQPQREESLSQKAAATLSLPSQPSDEFPDRYADMRTDAANYLDSVPEGYQDQLYRLYLEWNVAYPRESFQARAERNFPEMKEAFDNTSSTIPTKRSLTASLASLKLEPITNKTNDEWI